MSDINEMNVGPRWYVAHTYSGYENKVKANLEKIIENRGISHLIHEVKVPVELTKETNSDGVTKESEAKVFPSYVFVKMIMSDETWHIVRNIRGVTGFVGEANKAIPLTEEEVRQMSLEKHEIVVKYSVGETVRITDGPLASFTGIVEEIEPDKNKVRVVVSMFGRETPVELELDQVEVMQ